MIKPGALYSDLEWKERVKLIGDFLDIPLIKRMQILSEQKYEYMYSVSANVHGKEAEGQKVRRKKDCQADTVPFPCVGLKILKEASLV